MIDCLSNPSWIGPQTDFLLFLQNYRTGYLENFDKFFLSITIFGEFWLPTIICAIAYWCVDFRAGVYLLSLEGVNIFVAHLFKMLACVYRPWVLDERICPSKLAIPYAKGYSFPSGHSAMSSSVLGGVAYLLKNKKTLCFLLIGLVLLIGFSRLWLGVHTPQDVVAGLLIGFTLIFIINKIIDWAEKDKNRYLYLALAINVFAVLALIYVCYFNNYRIDYIGGEILVNPYKQIYVTCVVYGFALGLLNGCFLCRRFFPFNPKEVSVKRRILRGIIGAIITLTMMKVLLEFLIMNIVDTKVAMVLTFSMGFVITFVYPIIFIHFGKLLKKV
ncbi:phosphatase PAP2 family protein [bacterium]|nr:phosphatase PAP2 family protein [bacterium]